MSDGKGCQCGAHGEAECGCPDVDWTPQELIDARSELTALRARVEELEEALAEYKTAMLAEEEIRTRLTAERDAAMAVLSDFAEGDCYYQNSQPCLSVHVSKLGHGMCDSCKAKAALTRHAEKDD